MKNPSKVLVMNGKPLRFHGDYGRDAMKVCGGFRTANGLRMWVQYRESSPRDYLPHHIGNLRPLNEAEWQALKDDRNPCDVPEATP